MMRRRRPEQEIQVALFRHIVSRGVHGLVAFHPANGGYRTPIEAAILRSMGVTRGAPDVLLWHDGRSYAMELKAEDGRVTDVQHKMLNDLSATGVFTAVAHGLDEALAILQGWGLLLGRMQ
jgi:VRR-NUC domain